MKQLVFGTEEFEAERIVKTSDSIIGYVGESEVFAFRGVNDWGAFKLEEGQEWDVDPETEYALALAELAEAQEQDKTEVQLALAELAELIVGGA